MDFRMLVVIDIGEQYPSMSIDEDVTMGGNVYDLPEALVRRWQAAAADLAKAEAEIEQHVGASLETLRLEGDGL